MTEWRDVPGFPGYKVSDDGQVIGSSGRLLKGTPNIWGYPAVAAKPAHGPRSVMGIHILVCLAFHGPKPSPQHQVAHWDGDKTNNRPENLRWATPAENAADAVRHGTLARGEDHFRARFTEDDVRSIRARWDARESTIAAMAAEYGVSESAVKWIAYRWSWKHVV